MSRVDIVRGIVAKKRCGGCTYYEVVLDDAREDGTEWIREDLLNVPELIEAFEENHKNWLHCSNGDDDDDDDSEDDVIYIPPPTPPMIDLTEETLPLSPQPSPQPTYAHQIIDLTNETSPTPSPTPPPPAPSSSSSSGVGVRNKSNDDDSNDNLTMRRLPLRSVSAVKSILGHRYDNDCGGRIEYYVRWLSGRKSWVADARLQCSEDKKRTYWKRQAAYFLRN